MDLSETRRRPRVLIAKIGLDGHSRGAYVVAYGLRQAGMEVIYTGLRQTPAAVARAAVQEDVDVIGISSMVGAHQSVVRKLVKELAAQDAADIAIVLGGIVPEEDYAALLAMGVAKIFPPGARVGEIVQLIHAIVEGPMWLPEVPGSLAGVLSEGLKLLGTRCETCGGVYFPSRRNCPRCLHEKVQQIPLPGQGVLATFAVASVAPPGFEVPHAQGYIELEGGGPLIFSLLTDYGDGSRLKIGAPMGLKIVKLPKDGNDREIVGFRFRPLP